MSHDASFLRAGIRKAMKLPARDRVDDRTLLKMLAEDYEDFARTRQLLDSAGRRLKRIAALAGTLQQIADPSVKPPRRRASRFPMQ